MILAVFSEELPPLNAASSVLLKMRSQSLILKVHLQVLLHVLRLYQLELFLQLV